MGFVDGLVLDGEEVEHGIVCGEGGSGGRFGWWCGGVGDEGRRFREAAGGRVGVRVAVGVCGCRVLVGFLVGISPKLVSIWVVQHRAKKAVI